MAGGYLDLHSPVFWVFAGAVVLLAVSIVTLTFLSFYKIGELRRELRAHRKSSLLRKSSKDDKSGWEDCSRRLTQIEAALEELRGRVETQQQSAPPSVPLWPGPAAPMQLNRRGQILRLFGKGKSAVEIASDLGVSVGEVELILKVNDLSENNSEDSRTQF